MVLSRDRVTITINHGVVSERYGIVGERSAMTSVPTREPVQHPQSCSTSRLVAPVHRQHQHGAVAPVELQRQQGPPRHLVKCGPALAQLPACAVAL